MDATMPGRIDRGRIAALALAVALACLPWARARPAAADPTVEMYRSERFGHLFFFDASVWEIVSQESDDDTDIVVLSDGDVFAVVYAIALPDTTPRECVQFILDDVWGDNDSVVDISALRVEGPPTITSTESWAFTDMLVTLEGEDGRSANAVEEHCWELVPGESLIYTSIVVPAAAWNAGRTFEQIVDADGTGSSVTPWLAFYKPGDEAIPGSSFGLHQVVDAAGEPLGEIGNVDRWCQTGPEAFALARAYASGPGLVLDPDAFVGVEQFGDDDRTVPLDVAWMYPAARQGSVLDLAPGETALLRVTLPPDPYDLQYLPEGAPRVAIGDSQEGCGGGGGAAPVRIDME